MPGKCFHVDVADKNAKTLLLHCLLPSCRASFCAPTVIEALEFTATRNPASLEPVLYSGKANSHQTRSPLSGSMPVSYREKSLGNEIKNRFTACLDARPRTQLHAFQRLDRQIAGEIEEN
jgi:hypothetical protein